MHGRRLLATLALAATLLALVAPIAPRAHALSNGSAPHPGARTAALVAGEQAIVRADGDCLRLRATPGLTAEVQGCLAEGSRVTVLAGTTTADGFVWREVSAPPLSGWVAERYLAVAPDLDEAALACTGAAPIAAGISGGVGGSGVSLFVWGGGTAEGIRDAAVERSCNPHSVWATNDVGALVGYVYGAPEFVNRSWFALFPAGRISAPRALLLRCDAGGGAAAARTSTAGAATPLPAASATAPRRISSAAPPAVSARAAVVIDEASGAVLFEKDAHLPLAPASLTKIATAIATIEGADLDGWVANEVDARAMPGSSVMGLRPGDCFSVRDLLHGLLLPSGNDAALTLGRYVASDDAGFVTRLRTMLNRLGLTDTRFTDPHGLGGDGHESSAYDIAMLARYAMQLPDFAAAVTARSWTAAGSRTITLRNVNAFLTRYPGADGVKTGFTEEAGRTLAASATRDGRRLQVVVLNAPERFTDAERLLDWAFASFDFQ